MIHYVSNPPIKIPLAIDYNKLLSNVYKTINFQIIIELFEA